ncbi:RnfH family protein [Pseudomonas sp. FW215-R2]|uniref:RnfH family protein n=1 Tax=unclassified Pseudomonas TaxID=196821 RepID=UPI000C88E6C6|nr:MULTISPECIES: RnfH family protein [unclassified Pseudomonas]PMX03405.1 RnfH family protein [Pseudomonas sp. FW215-R2]PMX12803.1 RnfH family protein [Pseudomonas sp. FW215-L1]PMX25061.1 RnfH family protein [Pseudomonas sp. FW215-E1]PNA29307.1 RnfH family protein [Pseudomonas sp. FW215-R4]
MVEPVIEIEVVYAAVDRQVLRTISVAEGATVRTALLASGIDAEFPELDLAGCPVGIFGKVVADPDVRVVQAGDRLEIYRPLLADPKEVRRLRAAKAAEAKARNQ